ncbi:MAG: hypothetical protein ACR2L8_06050 [Solirubrobacteraceae bacterium]
MSSSPRSDAVTVTVHGETAKAELAGDFDMAATFTVEARARARVFELAGLTDALPFAEPPS